MTGLGYWFLLQTPARAVTRSRAAQATLYARAVHDGPRFLLHLMPGNIVMDRPEERPGFARTPQVSWTPSSHSPDESLASRGIASSGLAIACLQTQKRPLA